MELIDAHLHLQDERIASQAERLLNRARWRDVVWFVCNGTRPADWPAVLELARANAGLVPALGLHPWFVSEAPDSWRDDLAAALDDDRVQIGEIGLDRHFVDGGYDRQEAVFREQLQLAGERGRVAMVHCVKAWDRLVAVLGEVDLPPRQVVVHSFGGSEEVMRQLLDRGVLLSFSPTVVPSSRSRLQEVLAAVPLDRLLLETDSPDLFRRQLLRPADRDAGLCADNMNEPAIVAALYEFVAETRDLEVSSLAERIRENASAFLAT